MTKHLLTRVMCLGGIVLCGSPSLASENPASDIADAAMVLGLDSSNLAAVGVTNTEIGTVLDALDEEYTLFEGMMTQYTNEAAARRAITDANARLRIDSADTQAQLDLQNAQTSAALASSTAGTLRSQLINEVLDGVAESQLIGPVLLDESDKSRLPAPYRLAVDTNEEARTLKWALRLEARADANGGSLPSEASDALNDARAEFECQAAKIRIQSYETLNQTAIESWVVSN